MCNKKKQTLLWCTFNTTQSMMGIYATAPSATSVLHAWTVVIPYSVYQQKYWERPSIHSERIKMPCREVWTCS